ncbi:MAG: alpha/beta fold hydrolase [Eubacterium sp.]|nr:alpha/beta fold hydrolase [Eubacterium sp.]
MSKPSVKKKHWIRNSVLGGFFGTLVFLSMGWSFFRFFTYGGQKKTPNKDRKEPSWKWFKLKHTTINHPRYEYGEEYDKVGEWCEAQPMTDWYIRNEDGLRLHASWLPAEKPERIVMMVHGFRGHRFGSIASIAPFLHEHNCSILLIDQRCCGESEGKYITYGAREQHDVIEWLERIDEENPDGLPVYLYGQSMGAATVLLAAGHPVPGNLRGVIADCGFRSMRRTLSDIAEKWFHLKRINLLLLRVELFCRLFAGFSMKDTDCTEALKNAHFPVLFFHGEADTYVWPENTRENYELCRSEKELVLVPGARHLCSSYVAPELYQDRILAFFERLD